MGFGRGLSILVAAALSLAAAPPDPAPAPAPATVATHTDDVMRMTVPVTIAGQGPFQFIVDTGADRTVVAREVADRLKLQPANRARMHAIAGVTDITTVRLPSLEVAGLTSENISAAALDQENIGAQGLLGIDTLRGRRIVMDFARHTMSILPTNQREAVDGDMIVVTARSRYGQLVLVDADIDGTPVTVIVDSGAQNTIGNTPLRRLLAKRDGGLSLLNTQLIDVAGGRLPAQVAAVGHIRIGGLTVDNAVIAFADAHPFKRFGLLERPAMLLGMDTLRGFRRVSIDFVEKRVRFLPPKVCKLPAACPAE